LGHSFETETRRRKLYRHLMNGNLLGRVSHKYYYDTHFMSTFNCKTVTKKGSKDFQKKVSLVGA